jgi:hypothetical protein
VRTKPVGRVLLGGSEADAAKAAPRTPSLDYTNRGDGAINVDRRLLLTLTFLEGLPCLRSL